MIDKLVIGEQLNFILGILKIARNEENAPIIKEKDVDKYYADINIFKMKWTMK